MVARDEAQHLRAQYDFVVCGPDPLGLGRGFKVAFEPLARACSYDKVKLEL